MFTKCITKSLIWLAIVSLALSACAPKAVQPTATQTVVPSETVTPTAAPAPTETPAPTATSVPTETAVPAAEPIVLTDSLGKALTLASPAQRIVSLAPSITEILFAVGAGEQVVGRDDFSDYPAEALDLPSIGGGFGEINMEALVALQPDLVVAAEIIAPEQIEAIQKLGLATFSIYNPTTLEEMYEMLRTAAKLTGHETETLIADLQARVAAVDEKMAAVQEKPLVFYELDSTDVNAPWTAGAGTFIDLLIARAGGENLGGSLEGAWAQISIEKLLELDPDIILLGDATWGGVTPEMVAARAGWDALSAVRENRVLPFNDNLVSRPGPRLVEGLEALAQALHPELFK